MNRPLPTMFVNTSIAQAQPEEYDGLLQDEFATGRGAMVSFEVSPLLFAKEYLHDLDLDDSDDEDDTATSTNTDELDRGYARIESRLVRKHVDSGALARATPSSNSAHKGPTYHFTSHSKDLGLNEFACPDASRLSTTSTAPITQPTTHRRTNSCPTTDLSELIVDLIANPTTANESTGLQKAAVVSEMKKSAKDQAPAA